MVFGWLMGFLFWRVNAFYIRRRGALCAERWGYEKHTHNMEKSKEIGECKEAGGNIWDVKMGGLSGEVALRGAWRTEGIHPRSEFISSDLEPSNLNPDDVQNPPPN